MSVLELRRLRQEDHFKTQGQPTSHIASFRLASNTVKTHKNQEAGKRAQQLRALPVIPNELCSVPSTHIRGFTITKESNAPSSASSGTDLRCTNSFTDTHKYP